ncbi:peroxiredoxin [Chromohalobacter japonicus]|uniref:Peroxiredoxin n=1 Tax=Chromohalobacter japonicus TaxID=223900 RepID=A0A1Q8TCQ7_9GAMM|nr:OsmC family protein [Chromohalobacter japonicus]OLO11456.1 peroxiredoxin [Chromohalobacter japonicus]
MTITVITQRDGSLRQQATVREFSALVVDAPREVGGDESAPDPHDYFDLSLGACKAMTALMYARRKQLPVETITATVERDASDEARGHYRLTVTLAFEGIDDPETLNRLLEIADCCPIQRLMTVSDVDITTRRA